MIQKRTWSYTFVCSFIFENAVCNAQSCSTGAASVCSDMWQQPLSTVHDTSRIKLVHI